jgi:Family of unknown function (DUF6491)
MAPVSFFAAAAVFVALAGSAAAERATADPPAAASAEVDVPTYEVVRSHASLPAQAIRDQIMQADRSILVSTQSRHWYRIALQGGCTTAGWPGAQIGFTSFGGMIDRGSTAIIDGETCAIRSIDEIAAPADRPAKRPAGAGAS